MTGSDKKTTIIKTPFDASSAQTPAQASDWNLPDEAGSGNVPNWGSGFPSAYGLPLADGGKYVRRSELNHILRVFSNIMFNAQNGFPNLWSPDVATAIGGYPSGAVVWYEYNNALILLRSNAENNITPPVDGATINIDFSGGTTLAWAKIDFGLLSKDGGTLGSNPVTFTKGGTNSTLTLKGGTGTSAGALTLYGGSQATLSAGSGTNETKLSVSNGGVVQVQQGSGTARNIIRSINGLFATPDGNINIPTGVRIGIGDTANYNFSAQQCAVNTWYTVPAESFFVATMFANWQYGLGPYSIQVQFPGVSSYVDVASVGSVGSGSWGRMTTHQINFTATTFSTLPIRFYAGGQPSGLPPPYLYIWKPKS